MFTNREYSPWDSIHLPMNALFYDRCSNLAEEYRMTYVCVTECCGELFDPWGKVDFMYLYRMFVFPMHWLYIFYSDQWTEVKNWPYLMILAHLLFAADLMKWQWVPVYYGSLLISSAYQFWTCICFLHLATFKFDENFVSYRKVGWE